MREGLRSRTGNGVNSTKEQTGAIASGVEREFEIDKTDYTLWRLKVEHGRQTWHYITPEEAETWPQSIPEKYHLGLETVRFLPLCVFSIKAYIVRDFPNWQPRRQSAKPRERGCHFTQPCKPKTVTGPVNTVVQCFLFPASSSPCI